MGACLSKSGEESTKTKKIDESLQQDKVKMKKELKLLLLGAGESGKSTVFKQMKIIHDRGFTDDEKRGFVPIILKHSTEIFQSLYQGAKGLELLSPEQEVEIEKLLHRIETEGFSDESATNITKIWHSEAIQSAYSQRQKFHLPDSAKHFMENMTRVIDPGYIPTHDDILACRVRTTGVSEMTFDIDNVHFRVVDVGGQRNERRKWIHCFEDVQGVVFVAAISEYDQVLFEDDKTNRLRESVRLFAEISNTRFFADTTMILFLNKKDLFEDKIKQVDPTIYFPEYSGGCQYEPALEFFRGMFVRACKQEVFVHVTCARSTSNIRFVFDSVKESMLMQNVAASGML